LQGVQRPNGTDEGGAVLVGDSDATTVVETFVDYQCPFCQRWEAMFGTALMDRALQPGSGLLVKQHNLAFLKETSATLTPAGASARAANAAACVVDHDGAAKFAKFSRSLFEVADPAEPPGQFTAEILVELATRAGVSAQTLTCIEEEQFVPFVAATTQAGFARGVTGTPTVVVNGATVNNAFSDPAVTGLVQAAS
jgi:protein-disulfide isomerase